MTAQETLTKAIQLAIDGGYVLPRKGWEVAEDAKHVKLRTDRDFASTLIADYKTIIFNHGFAKALWGDHEPHHTVENHSYMFTNPMTGEKHTVPQIVQKLDLNPPGWKLHLQQMVIAENPFEYLRENLPD